MPRSHLYLNVNVLRPAIPVSIHFRKLVADRFGFFGMATTWDRGSTGTHGSDALYILNSVSRAPDEFMAAYLRLNEEACGAN